jgi:hypothetical protein
MHGRKQDGAFKTLRNGSELVRAKMPFEVGEVIDHAQLTNMGSTPILCATLLHTASTAVMESVMVPSCRSCVCIRMAIQRDAR